MKLMTSTVIVAENLPDDFEEGEILDDDSPVNPQEICVKDNLKVDIKLKVHSNNSLNVRPKINSPLRSTNNGVFRSGRSMPIYSGKKNASRCIENVFLKDKERPFNKRDDRNVIRRSKTTRINRNFSGKDSKSKIGVPYKRKLLDYEKLNPKVKKEHVSSSSSGKKLIKEMTMRSITKPKEVGSSLLKRLVGSGSTGIKLPKSEEQSKPAVEKTNNCIKDIDVNCGNSESSIPSTEIVSVESPTDLSKEVNTIEDRDTLIKDRLKSEESGDEEDELKLRMEALRTAMLKKHSKRIKQGLTLNKKSEKNASDLHEELSDAEPVTNKDITKIDCDYRVSATSVNVNTCSSSASVDSLDIDSCIISDRLSVDTTSINGESSARVPDRGKRKLDNSSSSEEVKLKVPKTDTQNESVKEDLAQEMELRNLALMSFLLRNKEDCQEEKEGSEEQSQDNMDCDMRDWRDMERISQKIDSYKKEDSSKRSSPVEDWQEVDEDILRAQLLQTLAGSLPDQISKKKESSKVSPRLVQVSTSKQVKSKKDSDKELDRLSKLWSEKMVPKLVISLGSDSESESEQVEKSVDKFLLEARLKSDSAELLKQTVKKRTTVLKTNAVPKKLTTPIAVKHLPIHQQEEYRRLKIKLAEKERLRKTVLKKLTREGLLEKQATLAAKCPEEVPQPNILVASKLEALEEAATSSEYSLEITNESISIDESEEATARRAVTKEMDHLSQLAREAEEYRARYNMSVDCVSRLKRELEEAEVRMAADAASLSERCAATRSQWEACTQTLQRWILCDKSTPQSEKDSLSARLDQELQRASNAGLIPDQNPLNKWCCEWDPDQVLCPYHLSGQCKDPSCAYVHLQRTSPPQLPL